MLRMTLAAFAAAAAAFAVGAPVASAAVTNQDLSATRADGMITFSYKVPAGLPSAVLVDFNHDGVSDYAISAAIDAQDGNSALGFATFGSTSACQQYWGYDESDAPGDVPITVTSAGDEDVVTLSTDDDRLRTAFEAKAVSFGGDDGEDFCPPVADLDTMQVRTGMSDVSPFDFTAVPPAAPANLKALAGDGQVELSWDAVKDADTYNVFVDGVQVHWYYNGTVFTVDGLENGRAYSFQVEARNMDGTSVRSAAVVATPQAPVVNPPVQRVTPTTPTTPQPPANPRDTDGDGISNDWLINGKPALAPAKPKVGQVTGKSITVKLPKAPKGSKLAVYVGTGNGKFSKAKGKLNKKGELTVKGLKKNTTYEVKVVKVNQAGKQSAASNSLKVKTKNK